ncbi:hypothetical protein SmJEL517_g03792 [Synchytrium microbalum]|uniref:Serine/threonine-protein kinase PRP4 homolog n=1 Tax=Synchytrium microbalum TaxID=1806994 RepID=A0A507C6L0_9FUNG|nr:uncharacterized protein SmJEL517_g03792 [Synchytrium microbalum]TPX33183.1 hypothetical protein SmJEL517_g03792 [Synchytrium microbalum]
MADEEEGEIIETDLKSPDVSSVASKLVVLDVIDLDNVDSTSTGLKDNTASDITDDPARTASPRPNSDRDIPDDKHGRPSSSTSKRHHHSSDHRRRDKDDPTTDHKSSSRSSRRDSRDRHDNRDSRRRRRDDLDDRERSPSARHDYRDRRSSPGRRYTPAPHESSSRDGGSSSRTTTGRDYGSSKVSYNDHRGYSTDADRGPSTYSSSSRHTPPRDNRDYGRDAGRGESRSRNHLEHRNHSPPTSSSYNKSSTSHDHPRDRYSEAAVSSGKRPLSPDYDKGTIGPATKVRKLMDGKVGSAPESGSEEKSKEEEIIRPQVMDAVDEDRLIEERRQRRKALLEQYSKERAATSEVAGAAASGEALEVKSGAGAVDIRVANIKAADMSRIPSSDGSIDIPTPRDEEESAQPDIDVFSLEKHNEGTNAQQGDAAAGDDIDAADYNPDEDKKDDEYKLHHMQHPTASTTTTAAPTTTSNKRKQDDMFADSAMIDQSPSSKRKAVVIDDEDDMFAPIDDMFAPPASSANADGMSDTIKGAAHILESAPVVRISDNPSLLDNWDDPEGYYRVILGEVLEDRYHVYANLGRGVFSSVVKAKDTKDGDQDVAIKIIRNNETMYRAGIKEAGILRKLNETDPDDKKHVVRLLRQFEHRKHLCLVFESLSMNLREVLKKFGKNRGLNIRAVKIYSQQLFQALHLLKKCTIMHADIKPDNVLVSANKSSLKLCDLGSASDSSENEITPYLVSRFYRAPEISKYLHPNAKKGLNRFACTLYELYTGKILFPGRTNNQMLKLIMEVRGRFAKQMLRRGQFSSLHFDDDANFLQLDVDKLSGKDVKKTVQIPAQPPRDLKGFFSADAASVPRDEAALVTQFADLLDKCLQLNPEKRISPKEALLHPFISDRHIITTAYDSTNIKNSNIDTPPRLYLPVPVLDCIIEHTDAQNIVYSAALVSKEWNMTAIRKVYKTVDIYCNGFMGSLSWILQVPSPSNPIYSRFPLNYTKNLIAHTWPENSVREARYIVGKSIISCSVNLMSLDIRADQLSVLDYVSTSLVALTLRTAYDEDKKTSRSVSAPDWSRFAANRPNLRALDLRCPPPLCFSSRERDMDSDGWMSLAKGSRESLRHLHLQQLHTAISCAVHGTCTEHDTVEFFFSALPTGSLNL